MCGENGVVKLKSSLLIGSPPRVRGKRFFQHSHKPAMRITPACAGKTSGEPGNAAPAEDHPRVCGENISEAESFTGITGSPPRVRGKLERVEVLQAVVRITPACAGKTPCKPCPYHAA